MPASTTIAGKPIAPISADRDVDDRRDPLRRVDPDQLDDRARPARRPRRRSAAPSPAAAPSTSSANGVTVPAIRKKIIVWSRRRIQRRDRRPLPVDAVIERADPEQRREADRVDRDREPRLGSLGERRSAPAPRTSETKKAYSCETPRSRGLTLAICSAAASLASANALGGRVARVRPSARRPRRGASPIASDRRRRGRSSHRSTSAVIGGAFELASRGVQRREGSRSALRPPLPRPTLHLAFYGRRRKTLAASRIRARWIVRAATARPACSRAGAPTTAPRSAAGASARPAGSASPPTSAATASRSSSSSATARASASTARSCARRCCARPTSARSAPTDVEALVDRVELAIETGGGELGAERIGELCLQGLRDLDHGAYLQFLGTLPSPNAEFAESAPAGSVRDARESASLPAQAG